MAGAKYASPEKGEGATLPGKPQDAWNSTEAGRAPGATPTHKRRNSVVDLLDELATGDEDGAITRAGFDKLCEQMGVNMNALERRRAFASLDKLDGTNDGRSQYSYVRPCPLSLVRGARNAGRCPGARLGQEEKAESAARGSAAGSQAVRHGR